MKILLERSGLIESVHTVHVAAVDAGGRLLARSGDPGLVTFLRSAAKPFQALPLVEEGVAARFRLTTEELAVACASHGGEPLHLAVVRSILAKAGVPEEAFECGAHLPLHLESAHALLRAGRKAAPIHNNCSGKHAGMLALARSKGWPLEGYRLAEHPVQERMLAEVARWTGVSSEQIGVGTDGCGVACFSLSIRAVAFAFARFAAAAARNEPGPETIARAMGAHPFMVAGTGRLCSELIEATKGRILAKVGAEGVYGALDRERSIGIALKVEDGARRACEVALLVSLMELGLLTPDEIGLLEDRWHRVVPNTRGEPVARLRAEGHLEGSA